MNRVSCRKGANSYDERHKCCKRQWAGCCNKKAPRTQDSHGPAGPGWVLDSLVCITRKLDPLYWAVCWLFSGRMPWRKLRQKLMVRTFKCRAFWLFDSSNSCGRDRGAFDRPLVYHCATGLFGAVSLSDCLHRSVRSEVFIESRQKKFYSELRRSVMSNQTLRSFGALGG